MSKVKYQGNILKKENMSLDNIVSSINNKYGDVICKGSDFKDPGIISFGNPLIDYGLLEIGGIPEGKIIELFGPESSGKSTLALLAAKDYLNKHKEEGKAVAIIDLENGMDRSYLSRLGVDPERTLILRAKRGQTPIDMLGLAEEMFTQEKIGIIIIDSVAGIGKNAEVEDSLDKEVMAGAAQVMSKFLRRVMYRNVHNTTIFLINQIREKVGVMFGSPEDSPGGRAIKHYTSARIRVSKIGKYIEEGGKIVGQNVRLRIKKSKFCSPNAVAEFVLYYNGGFDEHSDIFNMASSEGIITRRGSSYYYEDISLGNGKDNSLEFIRENEEVYNKILVDIQKINRSREDEEELDDGIGPATDSIEDELSDVGVSIKDIDLNKLEKENKESPLELLDEKEENKESSLELLDEEEDE